MKHEEVEEFVERNGLLSNCKREPGIYAITINDLIAYVGQSKNVYQRCCSHIYGIENAGFNKEKKYELLLSAKLGGYKVDCKPLCYCDEEELNKTERYYINLLTPPLNIITPNGKQDISNLTICGLVNKLVNLFYENREKTS